MIDPLHDGAAVVIVYALRRSASVPWLPLLPGAPEYTDHSGGWSTIYPLSRTGAPGDLRYHVRQIVAPGGVASPGTPTRGVYAIATEGEVDPGAPRGATRMLDWLPGLQGSWTLPELRADASALAVAIRDAWPVRTDELGDPIVEPIDMWWSLAGADHRAQALSYVTVGAIPSGADTAPQASLVAVQARSELATIRG